MVTVYVPGVVRSEDDTNMVEVPDPFAVRATPAGLKETVGSTRESDAVVSAGATEAARFTVPTKLYRLLRVIIEVPDDPTGTVMLVGLADMVKSGGGAVTTRLIVRVRTRLPLVALTLTL
jgi:hypothetical protein